MPLCWKSCQLNALLLSAQEGDSFTLCFYEAIDAVTFVLMVRGLGGRDAPRDVGLGHVGMRYWG